MYLKRLIIVLVTVIVPLGIQAQSNTMYYLPGVPQSYTLNPATQPFCNLFIGMPVLNSIYLEVNNTGPGPTDFIWNDELTNQVIHPLHPDANLDDFLAKYNDENNLSLELDFSPISFGFRVKEMYFTFDMSSRMDNKLSYGNNFTDIVDGIEDYSTYAFNSLGINVSEYFEFALGVSRKFGDEWTVGIRPKLLTGVASISSTNNDIALSTSHEVWQFDSQLELQIATPGFIIPTDEAGKFDPEGDFDFDPAISSTSDYRKLATQNKGLGVDLGVHFTPMEELTVSASIIDLGYINWKKYVHTATLDGSYPFEGVIFSSSDTVEFLDYVWDSIKGNFDVSGGSDPFKTTLDPKVFVGGSYSLFPTLDVGLLARFDLLESGMESNLMVHGNWHPSTVFAIGASYNPFGKRASTFGLALTSRLGPFHLYVVADYRAFKYNLYESESLPIPIPLAVNRTRFNLRLGLNLVFGCNQQKRLSKDKPMYYSEDY